MDFVLRPGERMTRYFHPKADRLYYLPYKWDGVTWREFPQQSSEFNIRTEDGPRSQKDPRTWASGKIEYRPPAAAQAAALARSQGHAMVFAMPCPYVLIDAQFSVNAQLQTPGDHLIVETSIDDGRTWTRGATLDGPFHGLWATGPAVVATSAHGKLTAVTGGYGYLVRLTIHSAS